ncbi:MAG TPA: hypothetical protein VEB59_14580 [Gemmatimonadales bacterium]|nr:hypothetical protein [Gemmatimonadales bacterium]
MARLRLVQSDALAEQLEASIAFVRVHGRLPRRADQPPTRADLEYCDRAELVHGAAALLRHAVVERVRGHHAQAVEALDLAGLARRRAFAWGL